MLRAPRGQSLAALEPWERIVQVDVGEAGLGVIEQAIAVLALLLGAKLLARLQILL